MKRIILFAILFIPSITLLAQSSGDYRSAASGNWNANATWEKYDGSSWVAATATPTNSDGAITILNGHAITVTASVSVDQVTVNSGGQLNIGSGITLTIANGTGTDLDVYGTVDLSGGTFGWGNSATTVIENGGVLKNSGTLAATAARLTIASGGKYQHASDGGTIPTATWDSGSTCEIIGQLTSTSIGGLGQSFYNFIWNCSSQTSNTNAAGNLTTVNGNLTITTTNTGTFRLSAATNPTLAIAGNFSQSGGTFELTNSTGNPVINLSGNFSISGGTLNMSSGGAGIGTLNISGNSTISGGTITESSSGSGTINFAGSSTQSYSKSSSTISNTINFAVNSGATLSMGTNVIDGSGGTFTLNSGATLQIGSTSGITSSGASGNIQVSGTRTFNTGANYTYYGSAAQVTGSGLPNTVYNLTVNNSAGVALSQAVTVSATLTLTSGALSDGGYTLTVNGNISNSTTHSGAGKILLSGGSSAHTLSGTGTYQNLELNDSNGATLSANTTVAGTLTLTSGNITTTNSNLLTLGSSATVSGGSSSSFVDGPIASTGTGTKTYPVGKGTTYRPVTLGSIVGTNPIIQVEVFNSNPGGTAGTGLDKISTVRYWTIALGSGSFTSATVNLTYDSDDGVTDNSNLRIGTTTGSANGTYSSIGGTGSANTVGNITSSSIGSLSTPSFFVLGNATGGSNPLPVELTSFTRSIVGKKVNLNWQTATEVNNYGFNVERRVKSEEWTKIGFVQGNGNSNSPKNYSFKDEPLGGKEFKYRLKQIDFDGAFEYSDEVTAVFEDVTTFALEQNYPNPFNPVTRISYTIPQRSNVKLRVYNMLAQLEAELVNESQEAGHYQVVFNGSNLPSGTYFYKLEAGKYVEVKKFLLVK